MMMETLTSSISTAEKQWSASADRVDTESQSDTYEYEWYTGHTPLNACTLEPLSSGTLVSTNPTASNLAPGDYTCVILNNFIDNLPPFGLNDWSQCRTFQYLTISELDLEVITEIDVKEIECYATAEGLVNMDVQDEGLGATYTWSNGTDTFAGEGLVTTLGGDWQLTVSYGDGCEEVSSIYNLTTLSDAAFDDNGT